MREVFRSPWNVLLATIVALAAFLFAVWLPNIALIRDIFGAGRVPLSAKIDLLVSLIGGIRTNFTMFSASYTILAAILLGVYVAMTAHYLRLARRSPVLRRRIRLWRKLARDGGGRRRAAAGGGFLAAGIGGAASGVLGVGCAACGSFLLTGLLSAIGAGGALALFPLGGGEFGILAVALLSVSVYAVARKINEPQVCGIEQHHE